MSKSKLTLLVDGNWLLDENGQQVKAVGTDGQNGSNGQDAVTPQLKIESGKWWVSYDNGASWIEIGQATGDEGPQCPKGEQGPQGNPGVGGDSMFTDVDYSSDSDYVIFTLGNGYQIKLPTWSAFEQLKEMCEQANSNISALQAIVEALQTNNYVKEVVPVYEGATEIGYIIRFADGTSATIYHGRDGQDGAPGADGRTPVKGNDYFTEADKTEIVNAVLANFTDVSEVGM